VSSRVPYLNARLQGYTTTIFAEMSALALATGSVNLGQGFPDTDGPAEIAEWAVEAIRAGHNQYPPGKGIPELRRAVAAHQREYYGLDYDPEDEVLVTAGATEAVAAALLSLCEPGDEVVVFEPFYDSYAAGTAMAGASRSVVQLQPPDWGFDPAALEAAVTARTRLVLLNSPHNPTGKVFSRAELGEIARLCVEHDLLAVTDEVYEHILYGHHHIPLASLPGMRERTVTISSAGKTFSYTGWKIGWVCAPPELLVAVRTAKQYLTYVSGAPFQHAIASALAAGPRLIAQVAEPLGARRRQLLDGLAGLGFPVLAPSGSYFVTTDVRPLGFATGLEFTRALPERCGVVAIPSVVFYDDRAAGAPYVRWTFCKQASVIDEALTRLAGLAR
jgi:N-succinyldiaminopimelate aminotransferase